MRRFQRKVRISRKIVPGESKYNRNSRSRKKRKTCYTCNPKKEKKPIASAPEMKTRYLPCLPVIIGVFTFEVMQRFFFMRCLVHSPISTFQLIKRNVVLSKSATINLTSILKVFNNESWYFQYFIY